MKYLFFLFFLNPDIHRNEWLCTVVQEAFP
jgi:hypothetical protein